MRQELSYRLESFLKLRQEWDELVLSKSLGSIVKIIELESEIRSTIQNSCFLQKCDEDQVVLEDGYAWKMVCRLNDYHCKLKAILNDMSQLLLKIHELNDHMETLVHQACNTHGTKIIFNIPAGSTWTLPKLIDHLTSLSSQYITSHQFHHSLHDVITSRDSTISEKQAALSYWACQPLMYDKNELKDLLAVEFPANSFGPDVTPRKYRQT